MSETSRIIYLSFTDTLRGLHEGKYSLLEMSAPEVEFKFGCQKDHVVRTDSKLKVPFEVSWLNTRMPAKYGGTDVVSGYRDTGCLKTDVEEAVLRTWANFLAMITTKSCLGKVEWSCARNGNYNTIKDRAVMDGCTVYYRGQKFTPKECVR